MSVRNLLHGRSGQGPHALRITRRCLVDDLDVLTPTSGQARAYVSVHRVVQAFINRRSQRPTGQETFRCATREVGKTIYTFHDGDNRGATWHETSEGDAADDLPALNVVWLLGCRPAHDYDALCNLKERLLPATVDYQAILDEESLAFATVIVQEVPALAELARQRKGQIVEGVLGERIPVRLYWDPEDEAPLLTVAVRTQPLPGAMQLVPNWAYRTVLAFFPKEPPSPAGGIGGQPLQAGWSAFCDFAPRP